MSTVDEAVEVMGRAERKIVYLRSLLGDCMKYLPTEDQCCDEDIFLVRKLRGDIFEEIGGSL